MMAMYVQALIDGLLLGGVYATVAVGLSLCFGVMRIINWAHGALLMMSMYLAYYLVTLAGINVYLCCIITGAVMFGVGYLLQKFMLYKLIVREKDREPISVLLFTSGLGTALTAVALIAFGGFALQARTPYTGKSLRLSGFIFSQTKLISFVIAIVCTFLLLLFLRRTETGRAMTATSQNRTVARLMGINEEKVYCLAMGISQAMVGISAALLVSFYPVSNTVGVLFSFKSFIIVVLGGKGSVMGCLVGGLLVGIIE
ncbi:MAG: branched-chain amino acid ABC transporter permease, partial [Bacillota bacterium]|nr:branched-chain amino acid ABC transporter permease [Bacillota bacterium]